MKFRITMKDPDGVYDGVKTATQKSIEEVSGLSQDEVDGLKETRQEFFQELVGEWLQYQEYVTLEFDTEDNSCQVVKQK